MLIHRAILAGVQFCSIFEILIFSARKKKVVVARFLDSLPQKISFSEIVRNVIPPESSF